VRVFGKTILEKGAFCESILNRIETGNNLELSGIYLILVVFSRETMVLFIIISLLVLGLVLLIVEVVFIPGTTVVGLLGIALSVAGVLLAYQNFGKTVGFYVMLATLIATGIGLYLSFKSGAWRRFANKSAIESRVNEGSITHLKVGDTGETLSALRPFGKAEFGSSIVEVRSAGNYAEPKSKVRIVQIEAHQIIVEIIT
jgi:membrane-bound ClpP family serine protease